MRGLKAACGDRGETRGGCPRRGQVHSVSAGERVQERAGYDLEPREQCGVLCTECAAPSSLLTQRLGQYLQLLLQHRPLPLQQM